MTFSSTIPAITESGVETRLDGTDVETVLTGLLTSLTPLRAAHGPTACLDHDRADVLEAWG